MKQFTWSQVEGLTGTGDHVAKKEPVPPKYYFHSSSSQIFTSDMTCPPWSPHPRPSRSCSSNDFAKFCVRSECLNVIFCTGCLSLHGCRTMCRPCHDLYRSRRLGLFYLHYFSFCALTRFEEQPASKSLASKTFIPLSGIFNAALLGAWREEIFPSLSSIGVTSSLSIDFRENVMLR